MARNLPYCCYEVDFQIHFFAYHLCTRDTTITDCWTERYVATGRENDSFKYLAAIPFT